MTKINIVSLFSGCGGLDLGFELAGDNKSVKCNIIWANDILDHACETFSRNFEVEIYENPSKDVKKPSILHGDVKDFNFKEKLKDKQVDAILGGFPCQDFSITRGSEDRKGIKVERGKLYMHFVRALIELQPAFFVAENVKGLVSANNGEAYRRIIEDFENLNIIDEEIEDEIDNSINSNTVKGYHIVHKDVVDFSNIGVPQKRQRLVIIGVRKDLIDEDKKEKIRNKLLHIHENTALSNYPVTTLEVFKGKPLNEIENSYAEIMKAFKENIQEIDSDQKEKFIEKEWSNMSFDTVNDYFKLHGKNKPVNPEKIFEEHKESLKEMEFLNAPIKERSFPDSSNEELKEIDRIKNRMAHIPPGENHKFVRGTKHSIKGLMSNIYRRIHPIKPSKTIIANGGGGTWGYHYKVDRQRLTNRERARIQSFPDRFEFSGKSGQVRTQVGNAVPPYGIKPFAEKLLEMYKEFN